MERVQLRCFYTKVRADEDVLGYGVQAEYHADGNLKSVSTELDALSSTAFHQRRLRRGVWGEEFTHFLPLVLNAEHGRRAMWDLERSLAALACGRRGDERPQEAKAFEPWMALAVLPQLMNSFVVALMSAGGSGKGGVVPRHASERALLGYCSFHHMLLALSQEHPSIVQVANQKLLRFVQGERTKDAVPDLGQLIVYLAVADAVPWSSVAAAVVDECHVRSVLWLLRSRPNLARGGVPDRALLAAALEERLTSVRLLMFQSYFLRSLARPSGESLPQALARYNRQFGLPTAPQKEMLVQATKDVLAVRSWPQVFRRLGLAAPAPDALAEELREAMKRSLELGYHGGGAACRDQRQGVQKSLQQAFDRCAPAAPRQPPRPQASGLGEAAKSVFVLSAAEGAEARKAERALREIARLEERLARGERLDALQLRKIGRREGLESSAVMLKVRAGALRPA